MRSLRRAAVLGAGLAVALASPASAAVTIGQTQSLNTACAASSFIELQDSTAPGNVSFAVPAGGGVITRWSHDARQIAQARLRLKVARRVSGLTFTIVGESPFEDVASVGPHTFATQIAVQPGDVIGVNTAPDADQHPPACLFATPGPLGAGDFVVEQAGDPGPGSTISFAPAQRFDDRINVSADVEPDVDGDGLGDETQDQCVNCAAGGGSGGDGGGGGGQPGAGSGGGSIGADPGAVPVIPPPATTPVKQTTTAKQKTKAKKKCKPKKKGRRVIKKCPKKKAKSKAKRKSSKRR